MILWLIICLVVLVWAWPHIWFRMVQDKVEVDVAAEKVQVEQGDEVPVRVTLRNRSWLPCPYVELTLELPQGLSARADKKERTLRWQTYAFMRQEVTATFACYAIRRGLHELGQRPVVLRMNEGFGLRDLFLSREFRQEIVVLPKVRPMLDVRPELDALVGDVEVRRWLHPDEAMLRGIRPWQPGDSHRHIAWLASARSGEWMTKEFSTTTDLQACLLLNAQFYEIPWLGSDVELFDELCSVTRAVAYALGRRKVPIAFASNATSPGQPRRRWYGEQTPAGITVLLGRFHPLPNGDFAEVLASVPAKVHASAPLVVVAHYLSERHVQLLRQHVLRGRRIHVVWSGDEAGARRLRQIGARVVPVELEIDTGEEVAFDAGSAGSAS
jgi:uncharacterized protein (DUF58 family)